MSAPHAEALLARAVAALEHLELRGALRARLALYRAIGWAFSYEGADIEAKVTMHASLGLATELAFLLEGGLGDDQEFFEAAEILRRIDSPLVAQLVRLPYGWPAAAELCREALNEQAFGELVEELESTMIGGAE